MAVVLETRDELLRLGGIGGTFTAVGTSAGNVGEERVIRLKPGVLEFEDIPVGANVNARVDRAHGLIEATDLLQSTQVVSSGGRTLTFADANPDTITASTGSFIADGFRAGMRVTVSGTASNDGTYIIASVSALVLTLVLTAALVAEGPLSGGETLDGSTNRAQLYRFELAPLPDPSLQLGLPAGSLRTQRRIITAPAGGPGGSGAPGKFQTTPTYAAFAPVQEGALFQSGKTPPHTLPMPGQAGATPDLAPRDRNLLRFRWVGQPVAGATLIVGAADTLFQDIVWVSAHRQLVPGSIRITLPTSTLHLRDDGKGRLVTESGEAFAGDGVVDYESGAFRFTAAVAETGNVLVDYEHDCLYEPLDVGLSWDALMSQ